MVYRATATLEPSRNPDAAVAISAISGLSRAYNDPGNRLRLAAILCTMLDLREMQAPNTLAERPSAAPAPVASGVV